MKPLIVVTDLDGTLLDHEGYGCEPALPALAELRRLDIPLVLNSSKTAGEIARWRQTLDNVEPFVVENGAGIHLPDGPYTTRLVALGKPRTEILEAAHRLRASQGYRFQGFADMDAQALASCSGLPLEDAALALQREFTEPLVWQDSEEALQRFLLALAEEGITSVRGGRFLHLGGRADKGAALHWLKKHYAERFGEPPRVAALGDSDNDLPMLRLADYPVLVRSPVRRPPLEGEGVVLTDEEGPAGWNRAVLKLLKRLESVEGGLD